MVNIVLIFLIFFYLKLHAHEIHEKYEVRRKERDAKLKQFQSEVTQRVNYLEQLKREQLRIQSLKKVRSTNRIC